MSAIKKIPKLFFRSRFSRILFVPLLFFIYGMIAFITYAYYNKYLGNGDLGLSFAPFPLNIIGVTLAGYIYFFMSSFNIFSVIIFFTWTRFIRPASFARFLLVGLAGLLAAYLLGFLIFPFTFWKDIFIRNNIPRLWGDNESGNFIGNIIIGTLLSWSWFLPLWYYKLGDWFWRRGQYAKNE